MSFQPFSRLFYRQKLTRGDTQECLNFITTISVRKSCWKDEKDPAVISVISKFAFAWFLESHLYLAHEGGK
jgi:hypothetical protein